MINEIINKLENKNIAILGFGKEGKSTYNFIRKYIGDISLTIIDGVNKSSDELVINDNNLSFVYGDNYLDNLDSYDLIIKTPGISLKNIDITNIKDKITSQLELLLEVNSKNVIGVTGTKGKSTTSSLIYNVIKDQGKDVYLLGNIGVPVLDEIEKYNEDTILVVEMSSHQLEFIKTSPHISVLLNLYQDHLDHAGTLEHYHHNKLNIFKYQSENDIMLYSSDNPYTMNYINESYKAKKYDVSFDDLNNSNTSVRIKDNIVYMGDKTLYVDGKRNIIGDHNLKDIMFVVLVAYLLGLDLDKAKKTIEEFKPLKYRMEHIGIYDGIDFYIDTIATIPEATIGAISSINDIDTLIFGGENRNTDYSEFIEFLNKSNIRNLICMYDTGELISKKLDSGNKNIYFTRNMRDAYKYALDITEKGKICLLSPAASSKDVFRDYLEKGELFESLIKHLNTDICEHEKR